MRDLEELLEAFPFDEDARLELVRYRLDEDPETTCQESVEFVMFMAVDGFMVKDRLEWAEAVCDAAYPEGWDYEDRIGDLPRALGYAIDKLLCMAWMRFEAKQKSRPTRSLRRR